jgi:beta-N-acetylhexosaminidase
MKEKKRRGLAVLTLFVVCATILSNFSAAFSQENLDNDSASLKARALLSRLSPEERVGQLFLVTLDGSTVRSDSPIAELISDYHIGGVVLKRSNNNFTDDNDTLSRTQALINALQTIEQESSNQFIGTTQSSSIKDFVPLFIGISQSGDLYPNDQFFTGLTPVPSQMAIGATWNLSLAEEAGRLTGQELSALGINLIFNPSLDVLETPYGEGKGDLGVRTFGGDPYWVGEMGKAYISGLQQGSQGKMAVIAKNFPGRGSSDRLPDEDVATVRKSLEQLKLIELAPFFGVTNIQSDDQSEIADGLLLSHIRYQGFQGNIRATTKPVSFDQTAVDLLMNLPELKDWRENNGILVSDDLGSAAIRRFFNTGSQTYDARLIARNAFLAGNDLLYMDNLVSTGDPDRFQTYKETISLFVQKYLEDQSFAERVDASALRLLTLKFRLYPEFSLEAVTKSSRSLDIIGQNHETAYKVAANAITLISPRIEMLDTALPDEPGRNDRIVIFTDVMAAQQCEGCALGDMISVNQFQEAILRFYGDQGSGQINEQNILSYSFVELADYVANPFNRPEIESNLSRADWVIFIAHDQNTDRPAVNALHRLLSEKPEAIRNKNSVLFAFNAPYYYDATEISSFTAYFCLYTKIPAAFDIAARVLFKEMQPQGSPPVSISGIAYNLLTATSPDPNQVIELSVDQSAQDLPDEMSEAGLPIFRLGDNLPIKTGVVVDQNGFPVPDGTVVRFMLNLQGESLTVQQMEATTEKGIARTSFKLLTPGRHEIRVNSEPAINSQILLIEISEGAGAIISAITPTPLPTLGLENEPVQPELTESQEPSDNDIRDGRFWRWIIATIFAWLSGFLCYRFFDFVKPVRYRLQVSLWIIIGGSIAGLWQQMSLPGSIHRSGLSGNFLFLILLIAFEAIFGFLAWWILADRYTEV